MQFKGPGLSQSEDGGSADTFLPPAPSGCGWLTEYPAGSQGGQNSQTRLFSAALSSLSCALSPNLPTSPSEEKHQETCSSDSFLLGTSLGDSSACFHAPKATKVD